MICLEVGKNEGFKLSRKHVESTQTKVKVTQPRMVQDGKVVAIVYFIDKINGSYAPSIAMLEYTAS